MAMSKGDKERIANRVVEILRSPRKKELIDELRQQVFASPGDETESDEIEDVVYAVLQALEELYG
jgi:hypothetical protein